MHRVDSLKVKGPQGPAPSLRRVQGGRIADAWSERDPKHHPQVDAFSASPVTCGPLESLPDSRASPSLKGNCIQGFQMPLSDVIWLLHGRRCSVGQPICRAGVETQI